MDEGLKKRLIGATVLVSLVVIFVPMLLQREPVLEQEIRNSNIPIPPKREFNPNVLPRETEVLSQPPNDIVPIRPREKPPSLERRTPVESSIEAAPDSLQTRAGLTSWVIQVASFGDQDNAERLVKLLREQGFSTSIQQEKVNAKTVYRVLVGPEIDRNQAEKLLARLNDAVQSLDLKGLIKSYP